MGTGVTAARFRAHLKLSRSEPAAFHNVAVFEKAVLRVATAKDRTVKRLLYDLIRIGERQRQPDIVKSAMRLRSVLVEIGHDV